MSPHHRLPEDHSRLRNIGIMAHIDAGKTTLSERILFDTGTIHRAGTVDEGSATLDWMPQEQERGITIALAATTVSWAGHRIQLIDTPGHVDFTVEVQRSLRVLDGAVAIFCGVGGVEPQSETVWHQADQCAVPRIAFVNKLDRPGADFDRVLAMMDAKFGPLALPVQLPLGREDTFEGVVDLVTFEAWRWDRTTETMRAPEAVEIPAALLPRARAARQRLVEAVAESSDELLERFVEQGDLEPDDIRRGLRLLTLRRSAVPLLCGSALHNVAIQPLLDAVVHYLPSPLDRPPVEGIDPETGERVERAPRADEPLSALCFKVQVQAGRPTLHYVRLYSGTLAPAQPILSLPSGRRERPLHLYRMHANRRQRLTEVGPGDICALVGLKATTTGDTLCALDAPIALERQDFPEPVIGVALEARRLADQGKLEEALAAIAAEDPTIQLHRDDETGQLVLRGMGELHLEVVLRRLAEEFKVEARAGTPQVAYRESVRRRAEGEGRVERVLSGRSIFGHCRVEIAPAPQGQGVSIADDRRTDDLPKEIREAVMDVLESGLESGPLLGYPLVDLRLRLVECRYSAERAHEVAYRQAASMALREAFEAAEPILLEPIVEVEILVPGEFLGEVLGDLGQRKGRVEAIEGRGQVEVVRALAPLARMFGYATDLRSLTQGRATFSMHLVHHEPVESRPAEAHVSSGAGP